MLWSDLVYETERAHPFALSRVASPVEIDADMLMFYRQMTELRNENTILRRGILKWDAPNDGGRVISFARSMPTKGNRIISVFNCGGRNIRFDRNRWGRSAEVVDLMTGTPVNEKQFTVPAGWYRAFVIE